MVDTVVTLITPGTRTQDATGVWRKSAQSERQIFARMEDVSRGEFFNGGQAGLRPELKFTVFHAEYQGEAVAEFNGVRYAIYRTYHVPGTDDLELYMQREVGVHTPAQTPEPEAGEQSGGEEDPD